MKLFMVTKLYNYFMSLVFDTSTYGINSIKYHGPVLRNTILKNTIVTDKDCKTNVSFSQIYNMNHFKQVLKRHFVYNYSLE